MAFTPYNKFTKKDDSKVWMPFGSAMNAWAVINQSDKTVPVTAVEVTKAMDVIYYKAVELIEREEKRQNKTTEQSKPTVYPVATAVIETKYKDDLDKIDID